MEVARYPKKPGFPLRVFTGFAREIMVFARVTHGFTKTRFFGIYGFCSGFGRVFTGFVRIFTVFARVLHGLRHSTTTIPVEIWKRLEKSDSGFKTPNIPFWGVRQSSPKVKHLNRFWHMVGPIFGNSQTVPFSQISKN